MQLLIDLKLIQMYSNTHNISTLVHLPIEIQDGKDKFYGLILGDCHQKFIVCRSRYPEREYPAEENNR